VGLPARQRRVLERIESTLRGSDPKLAALYAIFARLTQDEEMPRVEQLRHRAFLMLIRIRMALVGFVPRLHFRLVPRQKAVLFFPLAVALAVTSIVFAARSSSANCTSMRTVAAGKSVQNTNLCRTPVNGLNYNR
jgi:hypothetical protein